MILFLVFATSLLGLSLGEVPDFIEVCGRKNPNLNACVIHSVEKLRLQLREGIPSLDIPSLNPLTLNNVVILNDSSVTAVAHEVKLYDFPEFECKDLHVDLENQRIDIDVAFKKIRLEAEYDVATRLLVPISGRGPINIVADDVLAKVTLKYQLVNRKAGKYLYFPSMTAKLKIKDFTAEFRTREGVDGTLAEGINNALEGSRQEIIETITPNLETTICERVLQLANKVCKHFTYDQLFPDRE